MSEFRIDALLPDEMARRAEYVGVSKAEAPKLMTFALAILAGAFISMGAVFATTIAAGAAGQMRRPEPERPVFVSGVYRTGILRRQEKPEKDGR